MEEKTIERIRRMYPAINASVHITSSGEYEQRYDGAYYPDRRITPLLLTAKAELSNGDTAKFTDTDWIVNGVSLNETALDDIVPYGNTLNVFRNVDVGKSLEIIFSATLVSSSGAKMSVQTQSVVLSTSGKGGENYTISIGESQIIQYNPFIDRLFLFEYKENNGIAQIGKRDDYIDENSYIREIPISLTKGGNPILSGYDISVKKIVDGELITMAASANGELITMAASANGELLEVTRTNIKLDLRLVEKADYILCANVNGREVASIQFSVNRIYTDFSCEPVRSSSIGYDENKVRNTAVAQRNGNVVEYPESIVKMNWFTTTSERKNIEWHEGVATIVDIKETGIGDTEETNCLEMSVNYEQKRAFQPSSDEQEEVYTDENGEVYITN